MSGSNFLSVTGVALRFDETLCIDAVALFLESVTLFLVDDAILALSFASDSPIRRLLLFEAGKCRSDLTKA